MTSSVEEMRGKLGPCWFCGDKATCGFAVLHDEVGPGLYKTCDRCSDAFKPSLLKPFKMARLFFVTLRNRYSKRMEEP